MKATDDYLLFLHSHGLSLKDSLGIKDIALTRENTLKAVSLLREARLLILGGDVYFDDGRRITVAYANWHTDRIADESHDDYSSRSCDSSESYISSFPTKKGLTPLFVLVVNS